LKPARRRILPTHERPNKEVYDGHASGIEKEYIPFHDILDIGDIMGPIIFCKAEAAGRE
jgi:hypothetical protein